VDKSGCDAGNGADGTPFVLSQEFLFVVIEGRMGKGTFAW